MTNEELLPCPFCGNTVLHVSRFYYLTGPAYYKVVCQTNGCGAAGPETTPESNAIAKWNARADIPALLDEIERLRMELAAVESNVFDVRN